MLYKNSIRILLLKCAKKKFLFTTNNYNGLKYFILFKCDKITLAYIPIFATLSHLSNHVQNIKWQNIKNKTSIIIDHVNAAHYHIVLISEKPSK